MQDLRRLAGQLHLRRTAKAFGSILAGQVVGDGIRDNVERAEDLGQELLSHLDSRSDARSVEAALVVRALIETAYMARGLIAEAEEQEAMRELQNMIGSGGVN